MRRVKTWALCAIALGVHVLGGNLLGWETSALRADLFPILFGAVLALVMDATLEENENAKRLENER